MISCRFRPPSQATVRLSSAAIALLSLCIGCAHDERSAESAPPDSRAAGNAAAHGTPAVPSTTEAPAAADAAASEVPASAPALPVVDKAGYQQAIANRKGKIVLVDYWASWCVPCRKQFPHTVELWHKYRDRGVDCVSLCFDFPDDADAMAAARQVLTENNATFETLVSKFGSDPESADEFDFDGSLPHYVIYDREGKVVKHLSSSDPTATTGFKPEMIDEEIEKLLSREKSPGDGE